MVKSSCKIGLFERIYSHLMTSSIIRHNTYSFAHYFCKLWKFKQLSIIGSISYGYKRSKRSWFAVFVGLVCDCWMMLWVVERSNEDPEPLWKRPKYFNMRTLLTFLILYLWKMLWNFALIPMTRSTNSLCAVPHYYNKSSLKSSKVRYSINCHNL